MKKNKIIKILSIFLILMIYFFIKNKSTDFNEIYEINQKISIFSKENKFGIIDKKRNILIKNEYDEISMYIDKLFIGGKKTKYSIYNLENRQICGEYDFIEQIGINEYKAGNNNNGNYAFISINLLTNEVYEEISKVDCNRYLGRINSEIVNIIDIKENEIKSMTIDEYNNFIKKKIDEGV